MTQISACMLHTTPHTADCCLNGWQTDTRNGTA